MNTGPKRLVVWYRGWKPIQLYIWGFLISHYRIPINQPGWLMESKGPRVFFRCKKTWTFQCQAIWWTNRLSFDRMVTLPDLLGQWLNGLNFLGWRIFSRENKPFKLFFQGPLAKWAETSIVPENWWLEVGRRAFDFLGKEPFLLRKAYFQGRAVSFKECNICHFCGLCLKATSFWISGGLWFLLSLSTSFYMGVSENNGTPKSSILIGFSIINHPFWGFSPYFWKHP